MVKAPLARRPLPSRNYSPAHSPIEPRLGSAEFDRIGKSSGFCSGEMLSPWGRLLFCAAKAVADSLASRKAFRNALLHGVELCGKSKAGAGWVVHQIKAQRILPRLRERWRCDAATEGGGWRDRPNLCRQSTTLPLPARLRRSTFPAVGKDIHSICRDRRSRFTGGRCLCRRQGIRTPAIPPPFAFSRRTPR